MLKMSAPSADALRNFQRALAEFQRMREERPACSTDGGALVFQPR
jgi:hypothetical protein